MAVEGRVEGVSGWAIGGTEPASDEQEAAALYSVLEQRVLSSLPR